jgi:hypothetical protein
MLFNLSSGCCQVRGEPDSDAAAVAGGQEMKRRFSTVALQHDFGYAF